MDVSQERINEIYSAEVVTQDGENLGSVGHVYLDDHTGEPSWITVKTGWFGTRQSLVPLDGAELTQDGRVRVAPTKETIRDAPDVDADAHLSAQEQDELFRYYESAGVDVSRYGDHGTRSGDDHHHKEDGMQTNGKGEAEEQAAVEEVLSNPGVHHTGEHRDATGTPKNPDRSTDRSRAESEQTDEEILGEDDLSDDRMIGDDSERATPEGKARAGLRRHENPQHSGPQN